MRRFVPATLTLLIASGCRIRDDQLPRDCPDGRCPAPAELGPSAGAIHEHPVMNLPLAARCRNYGTEGSCVCASAISLLRWQGRDDLADKIRQICHGGQGPESMNEKLQRLGIRYAYVTNGDSKFLEWTVRTRRGAGITFYPAHFVNLVDLTRTHATLLNNNSVERFVHIPREEFLRRWRSYGGWALTVVYAPAPPPAYRLAAGD